MLLTTPVIFIISIDATSLNVHHLLLDRGEESADDGAQLGIFAQGGACVGGLGNEVVELLHESVHLNGLCELVFVLGDGSAFGTAMACSVVLLTEEEHAVHEAGLRLGLVATDGCRSD